MKLDIQKLDTSPQALDAQSIVSIDEWVIVDSAKHKDTDEFYVFSKQMLHTGSSNGFIQIDNFGRLWVRAEKNDQFYPYHFEHGDKNFGLRIATAAAN